MKRFESVIAKKIYADLDAFKSNPRDYAMQIVEEGKTTADDLLSCCLKAMSKQDVIDMLDANELSPRFFYEEEED